MLSDPPAKRLLVCINILVGCRRIKRQSRRRTVSINYLHRHWRRWRWGGGGGGGAEGRGRHWQDCGFEEGGDCDSERGDDDERGEERSKGERERGSVD